MQNHALKRPIFTRHFCAVYCSLYWQTYFSKTGYGKKWESWDGVTLFQSFKARCWMYVPPAVTSRISAFLHKVYLCDVLLTYIIVYQYNETNVRHFLFSLLRIKGLYMFRALLAHPQEALHKRQLVYSACVKSVGCTRIGVLIGVFHSNPGAANRHNTHAIYQVPFV
jgi:hypothetical protein